MVSLRWFVNFSKRLFRKKWLKIADCSYLISLSLCSQLWTRYSLPRLTFLLSLGFSTLWTDAHQPRNQRTVRILTHDYKYTNQAADANSNKTAKIYHSLFFCIFLIYFRLLFRKTRKISTSNIHWFFRYSLYSLQQPISL